MTGSSLFAYRNIRAYYARACVRMGVRASVRVAALRVRETARVILKRSIIPGLA